MPRSCSSPTRSCSSIERAGCEGALQARKQAGSRKLLAVRRRDPRRAWRRQEVDVQLVLELARTEREHQPRLGVRKFYHMMGVELRAAGVKMGRDRLFAELRKAGLLVERKPSAWPKTTQFDPTLPNLF